MNNLNPISKKPYKTIPLDTDIIQTLLSAVENKDVYTKGHSDRVSELSVLIGERLGLEEDDLNTLRIGGLFHDIGKINTPDDILYKESGLTNEEYLSVQNHPIDRCENIIQISSICRHTPYSKTPPRKI